MYSYDTLAVFVITYNFDMINWTLAAIKKKINTKVKKVITCFIMHHSRADIERLNVKRKNGGKGLVQLELVYKTTTIGLKKYLDTATDWMQMLVNISDK